MTNPVIGRTDGLYDPVTREHLGVIDLAGREQLMLRRTQYEAIRAPGNLSGVVYDTSSRAVSWAIDGVTYTADYSVAGQITVSSSDSLVRVITLDPSGRIAGAIVPEG